MSAQPPVPPLEPAEPQSVHVLARELRSLDFTEAQAVGLARLILSSQAVIAGAYTSWLSAHVAEALQAFQDGRDADLELLLKQLMAGPGRDVLAEAAAESPKPH
ncbi:MAG: hypothetical protein F4010_05305 [Cenarchaeum sp. SB0669_bin_11]|nr:hypothetical protein [Cenarchaeum sp. SB0669_bin_11]